MPQDAPAPAGNQSNTTTPTTNTFDNQPNNLKKPHNKLIPITIILAILTLAGLSTSIFLGIQSSNRASEISELKTKVDSLTSKDSNSNEPNQTTTNESQPSNNQTSSTTENKLLYLEPEGWNVKFAYPEGVTEVIASANDNYDGTLYIGSITYNGKTYNVDLFGGKDAYHHYPFFLGNLMRWDSKATHESWEQNPTQLGGVLVFEQGSVGYYYNAAGGNGYETGNEADYNKAVELTSQLLHNITAK